MVILKMHVIKNMRLNRDRLGERIPGRIVLGAAECTIQAIVISKG